MSVRFNRKVSSCFQAFSLLFLIAVCFYACTEKPSATSEVPVSDSAINEPAPAPTPTIQIGAFTELPAEIHGCSCYYSADSAEFKKQQYLFASNFGKVAYMKIEGEMTRLEMIKADTVNGKVVNPVYKNGKYEVKLSLVDGMQNGDETWLKSGSLELTATTGEKLTQTLFGECGC